MCGRCRLQDLSSTSPCPAETELALASGAVEDLAAAEDAIPLVLDDLHVIASPAIHRALQFVVDHLPDQVTLVLVSRADPPLAVARLRASGWLTEVRAAELAFDPDESNVLSTASHHGHDSSGCSNADQPRRTSPPSPARVT